MSIETFDEIRFTVWWRYKNAGTGFDLLVEDEVVLVAELAFEVFYLTDRWLNDIMTTVTEHTIAITVSGVDFD